MKQVKIVGTGSYAPCNIMTNEELSKLVDTNDEWITSRTGIKQRRISNGENTSDVAAKAAINALESANVAVEDIDLLIVATTSPDQFVPSTACLVQGKIGAVNALAFDVSAACTGFVFGLNIASQFIKTGQCNKALVIGAEVLSKLVDWQDRNTCVLFGDGAGAAILESSNEKGLISIYTASDGSKAEVLTCPAANVINPYTEGDSSFKSKISMNGKDIFKFAVKVIDESINKILEESNHSLEDIKYIIPHQANLRMIDFVSKKMNIDIEKFYINLDKYGNTSAASIAIALDEVNKKGLLHKGDKIILVGFGGGLTYGASLIQWTIDNG